MGILHVEKFTPVNIQLSQSMYVYSQKHRSRATNATPASLDPPAGDQVTLKRRPRPATTLLNIAKKACDYLDSVFEHPTPELAENAVCPSHYMGMVEMYRTTRDRKYLDLAKKFIDMRDLVNHGTDDNQDRIPFRRQTKAVGHAVRANYLYAGAADIYAETGDRSLLDALKKIWTNVVFQKMYITGATGALYDGASPDGAKDQKSISRVHQAYGRE